MWSFILFYYIQKTLYNFIEEICSMPYSKWRQFLDLGFSEAQFLAFLLPLQRNHAYWWDKAFEQNEIETTEV